MTTEISNRLYNWFSKHLSYISKKYNVSKEDICRVVCKYIYLTYDITPELDDNVNFD